jgi:hypothetical protein
MRQERGEDPTLDLVGEEHARMDLGILYNGDGRGKGVGGVAEDDLVPYLTAGDGGYYSTQLS